MQQKALEVLNILESHGYQAYIVGGYVRDYLLHKESYDIDICTSATPKEILNLFENVSLSDVKYGSVKVNYKNVKFDITTFRKEKKYELHRKPLKV